MLTGAIADGGLVKIAKAAAGYRCPAFALLAA
jgi:hypothetical protein